MRVSKDSKAFRHALSQFPTGVTVVTTVDEAGDPVGMTASSFNAVSLDPPLVLWSVARSAFSASIFEKASFFTVNVLGKHQVELSNRFARAGAAKFDGLDVRSGAGGSPILEDTAACFQCRTWQRYDGGDHLIVVGEVLDYTVNNASIPLVFSRGSYAVSAPMSSQLDAVAPEPDGFLANYLLYQLHRAYSLYSSELYSLLAEEFGIYPEEWRLLTWLADRETSLDELPKAVGQPDDECRELVSKLCDRGYLTLTDDDRVRIAETGYEMARRLFSYAKNHEEGVLNYLPPDQREEIGDALRQLAYAFSEDCDGSTDVQRRRDAVNTGEGGAQ